MTREEAAKYTDNMTYRDAINNLMKAKSIPYRKATFIKVNELIKALEQKPCEDAISRQAVMDCFKKWQPYMATRLWDFEQELSALPSVNPQEPKWIPVSERLPEEGKTVMASTLYGVYPEATYTEKYGWEWAYESGADYWREFEGVTAWMPLPEPYKAKSEDKE